MSDPIELLVAVMNLTIVGVLIVGMVATVVVIRAVPDPIVRVLLLAALVLQVVAVPLLLFAVVP